ncbi:pyridoxamine 5'-phosphate oxidase family protein [Ideonella livida]|uniref:Pyridoxamine 5'-phosphate oxidase family protein n=1 Tax=Ideonella livida TaxID=2707176 RepID=A0A7C9TKW1_9BURK|nr:pyridoxamine 5'-phosphate oxidase family protein [Ideonella livida]NDY91863.1 pyridoxamine 5'-phosphate oxidase family protein [Ideonella livida]
MTHPELLAYAHRSVLCWLATVDAEGGPSVSPKEIFAVVEGGARVVIANIASPESVRNIRHHPQVGLSFIDVFVQKGCKIKGRAQVLTADDPDFARWAAPLQAMAGERFALRSLIVVHPHTVEPIVAPSYRLYPDQTTEAGQYDAARAQYNAIPRPD